MTDGVERCNQYIADVLDNAKPVPETIILACKRHRSDLERDDVYFDERSANIAVANIERFKHVKGRLRGTNIHLEPWQCFAVCSIFGWKRKKDGLRRFRRVYKQVPRKNGKTLIAICIALMMFGPDNEPGAEIYLGATGQDQAKDLLFNPAKDVVRQCPAFKRRYDIDISASNLVIPATFCTLKSVIKKPDDGYNPHCAIVDEYHEHDTDEQYETFSTGMGAREQPLLMVTTTAGSNLGGPCMEMYQDCKKVLQGTITDDSLFILIYEPDAADEWDEIDTVVKVNPNIDVSVSRDYLLDQLNQARASASKQNSYKTKHLNMWVGARTAWMNMVAWQKQSKKISLDEYKGCRCWLALDLASKKDVCALVLLFEYGGTLATFQKFYVPEGALEFNDKYWQYKNAGEITVTPGNATDYGFILEDVKSIVSDHNVADIAVDDFQANYFMTKLMEAGLTVVNYNQTVKNMSEPMKETEARILDGTLIHDGNDCMTWMIGNVTARVDAKDNIYPRKENDGDTRCKIDGPVALIMAMGRYLLQQPDLISPWEDPEYSISM